MKKKHSILYWKKRIQDRRIAEEFCKIFRQMSDRHCKRALRFRRNKV